MMNGQKTYACALALATLAAFGWLSGDATLRQSLSEAILAAGLAALRRAVG